MSTPTALRGPCNWGDEVDGPAASGATSLVAYMNGGHVAKSGSGNASEFLQVKCVCVCVCRSYAKVCERMSP